jgi:hypothetical protein
VLKFVGGGTRVAVAGRPQGHSLSITTVIGG